MLWSDAATLAWTDSAAAEYHAYRGGLGALGFADFGGCRDDLVVGLAVVDVEDPAPGEGFFYPITADDQVGAGGNETTLGPGACAERGSTSPA